MNPVALFAPFGSDDPIQVLENIAYASLATLVMSGGGYAAYSPSLHLAYVLNALDEKEGAIFEEAADAIMLEMPVGAFFCDRGMTTKMNDMYRELKEQEKECLIWSINHMNSEDGSWRRALLSARTQARECGDPKKFWKRAYNGAHWAPMVRPARLT